MKKRSKKKLTDIMIMVIGIGLIVAIFAAVFIFAPGNPFEEGQFLEDVGDANQPY